MASGSAPSRVSSFSPGTQPFPAVIRCLRAEVLSAHSLLPHVVEKGAGGEMLLARHTHRSVGTRTCINLHTQLRML